MSELIQKIPLSLWTMIRQSLDFVFKNIFWITLIGLMISLPELFLKWWTPPTEPAIPSWGMLLSSFLISTILSPFLLGTITTVFGEQLFGRHLSWNQGLQKSIKKFIPLVLLLLLLNLVIGLGFILLIIPGIIAMCATTCAIPAMMLENLGPIEALKRSWSLTKNNRFQIFALLCLATLTMIFISGIPLGIIMMGISMDNPLYDVLSTIILTPVQALFPAIATLLFFNLRMNKEAIQTNIVSENV